MKNNYKVSIIVPSYNNELFIGTCIESILKQTHTNFELIVVNDGSTDSTGNICDEYANKDNRIKVIHQPNSGVSSARNNGLAAATGDYVCFVDGDDYVSTDYIDYLLELLIKNNADISLTTEMFSDFDHIQSKNTTINCWTAEDATEQILCYKVPIGVYCKMFKKDFLDKNNVRFSTSLVIGEGFNFNTYAFQRADVVVAGHKKIYFYRKNNPTSVTTKFNKDKWENGLYAIEKINSDLLIKTVRIKNAVNYARWRTNTDVYDLLVLAKVEKKYPDMYKKCLSITKKDAKFAFRVPTSKQNKLRALIMSICPRLIPYAMILRKWINHVHVSH